MRRAARSSSSTKKACTATLISKTSTNSSGAGLPAALDRPGGRPTEIRMRRTLVALGLSGLLSSLSFGQQPAFEAADVHVSPPGGTESGGFLPNGRLEFRSTSLLRLIGVAYSVQSERVAGGPSWLDTDRFDVVAKAPGNAAQPAMRKMLQGVLAERFGLSVKEEERPQPAYVLALARK